MAAFTKGAAAPCRRSPIPAALLSSLLVAALGQTSVPAALRAENAGHELVIPTGTRGLLQAAGISVPVEPDRALLVLVRELHAGRNDPARIQAVLARAAATAGTPERVPGLLPPAAWEAVLGATVAPNDLAAAVLGDRSAAFLYQGLFAVDGETLEFFAGNTALLTAVYRRSAAAFAAYSDGIRVRGGRVEVPGGEPAERAWEIALGAPPADPGRFISSLLESNGGRLAQLFAALGRLDPAHLAFALGPSARDLPALIEATAAFDPHTQLPFMAWSDVDVPLLLEQVSVIPDGTMAPPRGQSFWDAALDGRRSLPGEGSQAVEVTAAWLVRRFGALPSTARRARLDGLLFTQRLAARGGPDAAAEWLETAASFPDCPLLFLTLEQLGASDPADYRAAARAAAAITAGHRQPEASRRLAAFQAGIVLAAQLERAGTLKGPAVLELLRELFAVAPLGRARYAAGMADWIERVLLGRLGNSDSGAEARLLDALAGIATGTGAPAPVVEWEGRPYVVDLAKANRERLEAVREGQGGPTLDEVLAQQRSGGDFEGALSAVLTALVYALVSDPDAPAVPGDGPWLRHDFGLGDDASSRAWRLVERRGSRGGRGSLLGLDRAMARDGLRPTMMGLPSRPPTLSLEATAGLAESVAALDSRRLSDEGRDQVAAALRRGRERLADAARRAGELDAVLASVGVDGIRRRLARRAAGADPSRVFENVSLGEVLEVGQASGPRVAGAVLDAWGVAARPIDGSLGTRMPRRLAWRERSGRPGSGLVAAQVADLHLRVVEWLAERRLPGRLAPSILAQAAWDLAMTAQVSGPDDWLPVVRAAQAVSSQRLEDYVSALTAGGPLKPASEGEEDEQG